MAWRSPAATQRDVHRSALGARAARTASPRPAPTCASPARREPGVANSSISSRREIAPGLEHLTRPGHRRHRRGSRRRDISVPASPPSRVAAIRRRLSVIRVRPDVVVTHPAGPRPGALAGRTRRRAATPTRHRPRRGRRRPTDDQRHGHHSRRPTQSPAHVTSSTCRRVRDRPRQPRQDRRTHTAQQPLAARRRRPVVRPEVADPDGDRPDQQPGHRRPQAAPLQPAQHLAHQRRPRRRRRSGFGTCAHALADASSGISTSTASGTAAGTAPGHRRCRRHVHPASRRGVGPSPVERPSP